MTHAKPNKILARGAVAAGTLLACLGIWASVVNSDTDQSEDPAAVTTGLNINPDVVNISIPEIPSAAPTGQASPTPSSANNTAAVQPAAPVAQPAPTTVAPTTPTKTQPVPTVTPKPRLVTRGS